MQRRRRKKRGGGGQKVQNSAVCITVNSSSPPSENGTASFTVPTRPNHSVWTFSPTTFFQAYAPPLCINLSICLFYLSQTSTRSCRHTQMPPPHSLFSASPPRLRGSVFFLSLSLQHALFYFHSFCNFFLSISAFVCYCPDYILNVFVDLSGWTLDHSSSWKIICPNLPT